MPKNILITGSTDGIGLATAKKLAEQGHNILLHGRSVTKVKETGEIIRAIAQGGEIEGYTADLSLIQEVEKLAGMILKQHNHLDVVIITKSIELIEKFKHSSLNFSIPTRIEIETFSSNSINFIYENYSTTPTNRFFSCQRKGISDEFSTITNKHLD